jgi:hypothetical protein
MELLESNDFKSELLKKSEKHRAELEGEVKLISERTEKILINALIIGGALAATYFLLSQFSGSKPKRKARTKRIKIVNAPASDDSAIEESVMPAAPGIVAQIGTALASQATVFLLDLAKEKLSGYLQAQAEKKEK